MLDDDATHGTTTLAETAPQTLAVRDTSQLPPLVQRALARARRGCETAKGMLDALEANPPKCPTCGAGVKDAKAKARRVWLTCTGGHAWAPAVPERGGR